MGGRPIEQLGDEGGRIYDRHVSLGSIISTTVSVLAAFGAAAGVWAATQSQNAVQTKEISHIDTRVTRIEHQRDQDQRELNQTLREINSKLGDIQVALATKEDIKTTSERKRP